MAGMEDCESLRDRTVVAKMYLVRHPSEIRRAPDNRKLDNVYSLPGPGDPADGLAMVKIEMVPL